MAHLVGDGGEVAPVQGQRAGLSGGAEQLLLLPVVRGIRSFPLLRDAVPVRSFSHVR